MYGGGTQSGGLHYGIPEEGMPDWENAKREQQQNNGQIDLTRGPRMSLYGDGGIIFAQDGTKYNRAAARKQKAGLWSDVTDDMGTYQVRNGGDQNVLAKKMKAMNVEGFQNSNLFDMNDTTFNRADYRARKAQARQLMPNWNRRQVKAYALSNLPDYWLQDQDKNSPSTPSMYWQDEAVKDLDMQDEMRHKDLVDFLDKTTHETSQFQYKPTNPQLFGTTPTFDEDWVDTSDLHQIELPSQTQPTTPPTNTNAQPQAPSTSDPELDNLQKHFGSKAPAQQELKQGPKYAKAANQIMNQFEQYRDLWGSEYIDRLRGQIANGDFHDFST